MILRELLIQYEMQNNLNHSEVADQIGVSLSTYYRWINGESTKLKKTTIQKISSILDCDIESVIEETNRVKPILGNVKAGYDLWAEQDIEGYIELGKPMHKREIIFFVLLGIPWKVVISLMVMLSTSSNVIPFKMDKLQ